MIFFGLIGGADASSADEYTSALQTTLWFHVAAFAVSALLALLLPEQVTRHEALRSESPTTSRADL